MSQNPARANRAPQPFRANKLALAAAMGTMIFGGGPPAAAEASLQTLQQKERAAAHRIEQRLVQGRRLPCQPNQTVYWSTPGSQNPVKYKTERPLTTIVNGHLRYVGLDQRGDSLATIKAKILPRQFTVLFNDEPAGPVSPFHPHPLRPVTAVTTSCHVAVGPESGPRHLPIAHITYANPNNGQVTTVPALVGFTTQTSGRGLVL